MALPDLTGRNIQDTYQRLVQVDNTGSLTDGTGSNIPISIEGDNIRVKGDIIAQNYIVSSSVTNVTFQQQSGSTIFGDSVDDTHTFTGAITSSGNISASGTIIGSNLSGTNTGDQDLSTYALISQISGSLGANATLIRSLTATSISESFVVPSSSFSTRVSTLETNNTGDQNITNLAVTGSDVIFNHITASGNISSSARIDATNMLLTNDSSNNILTHNLGGFTYNILKRHGSVFHFGANGLTTNISGSFVKIKPVNRINLECDITMFLNSSATNILRLDTDENFADFTSQTDLNSIRFNSNITSSGDISSSGTMTSGTSSFHYLTGDTTLSTGIETSGYLSSSALFVGDGVNHISASLGNFSGSGNIVGFTSMSIQYITASRLDVDGDTIKVGGEIFNKTLLQNVKDGFSGDSRNQGKGSAVFRGGIITPHITSSFISASNLIISPNILSLTTTTGSLLTSIDTISATTGSLLTSIDTISNVTASYAVTGSDVIFNHITASGNISASGNNHVFAGDVISNTFTAGQGVTIASQRLLYDSAGDNIKLEDSGLWVEGGHITASFNISASGEFIGHTFTHNVGYGSGRAFILGGVPGRYYTYAGGDLGIGPLPGAAAVGTALGATVFVAPYSCSLEQIDWSLVLSDGTSTSQFLMQSRAVKLPAYNNTSNQVDIREIIAPDVNSFDSTVFDELRAYRVSHTYTGSTSALLGPGDSLCLIYSASAGGKHTGTGMATATFRKI